MNTQPQDDSLVQSIVEALDEREKRLREASDTQWGSVKRLVKWKDIAQAVIFFGALVGGAFMTFAELRAKPSSEEVTEAIETRVAPLEETIDDLNKGMSRVESRVNQLEESTQQILDEVLFQGAVQDCLSDKTCTVMPERDSPLKDKP
jgi:exonuclease VII small subunit